jgi:ELWxxDGT repeat protein
MVVDLMPGVDGSSPQSFVSAGGAIYFTARQPDDTEQVYRYDDDQAVSATNPRRLDLPAGAATQQGAIVEYGGKIFFDGADSAHGLEWYVYDPGLPVVAGSNPAVMDAIAGPECISPRQPFVFDGKLLFDGFANATGHELWVYDNTAPVSATNPKLAVEMYPGSAGGYPQEFSVANGQLFFMADSAAAGREVWRFDPAVALSTTNPGPIDLRPGVAGIGSDLYVASAGSFVLFQGDSNNGKGTEPWILDAARPLGDSNPVQHDAIVGPLGAGARNSRACLGTKFCYSMYENDLAYTAILDPTRPFSATNPIKVASPGADRGDPEGFVTWNGQ